MRGSTTRGGLDNQQLRQIRMYHLIQAQASFGLKPFVSLSVAKISQMPQDQNKKAFFTLLELLGSQLLGIVLKFECGCCTHSSMLNFQVISASIRLLDQQGTGCSALSEHMRKSLLS